MTITCIPLGFRFHPTDVELIKFYLKRKVVGKRFRYEVIVEIDIYKYYPWDLPDKSCLRSKDLQWYFFCPRERKYSNGARMNRATEYGYWKTTGKDRSVIYKERIVGLIKTLIFHTGRAPNGVRTDWVMHEYRLEDKDLADAGVVQDAYVLCKIFQKSGSGPRNGAQYGAPFNEEEWSDDEDVAGVESFPLAGLPALAPVLQNNQDSSAVTSTLIPGSICIGSSSKPVQSPDNMIRPVQDEDVLMREVPLIPDDGNDICSMLDDIILVPNENHENENMDYSNGDGIIQTASLDVNYIYNDFAWPETLPELNEDELFSYGSKTDFASNQLPACEDGLYLELNDLQVLLGGPSDTYGSQGTPLNPVPSHYNFCTSSEQPRYPLNYYDDAVQDGSGISQSSVLPAGSYGFESHLVVNQEDNGVKEDANQGYREYEATLKNAEVTVWNQPELEIRYVSQGQTRGLRMNDLTTTTPMTVNGLGAFDLTPKCGMEFDSEEDAYNFYTAYGGKLGFGIRRDTYNKNRRTGEMTSRIFVCNKEGVRGKDKRDHLTKKPRQEIRAGCEARMSIKLNRHNGKYAINDIKEEHNHDLVIPECIHKLPSERKMSALQATKVELVEESRVPLRSAYELMGRQAGGRDSLGYTKQDKKNYLHQECVIFNPSFFHAECVQDMHGCVIQADASLQRTTRYRSLCSIFTRVSSRASESEETYNIALSKANKLLKLTEAMLGLQLDALVQDNENHTPPSIICEGDIQAHGSGKAHVIQAKGLKKSVPSAHRGKQRIKSPLQIASGSSVLKYITITDEDGPHPPPESQPSQTPLPMNHMAGNNLCSSMMYQTYLGLNVPKNITTTNEDSPHLPQHSRASQISLPVNHMAGSNLCSSMMYQTYPGPSVPNFRAMADLHRTPTCPRLCLFISRLTNLKSHCW